MQDDVVERGEGWSSKRVESGRNRDKLCNTVKYFTIKVGDQRMPRKKEAEARNEKYGRQKVWTPR